MNKYFINCQFALISSANWKLNLSILFSSEKARICLYHKAVIKYTVTKVDYDALNSLGLKLRITIQRLTKLISFSLWHCLKILFYFIYKYSHLKKYIMKTLHCKKILRIYLKNNLNPTIKYALWVANCFKHWFYLIL